MLHAEHLDVRSVTLALNLEDCAAPSVDHLCRKVRQKITSRASRLVEVCDRVGAKYGIPVINKRLAISPAASLLAGHGVRGGRATGRHARCRGRRVRRGFRRRFHGPGAERHHLRRRRGDSLAARGAFQTRRVCASVNVASRKAGINMDAVGEMGRVMLRIAEATAATPRLRLRQAGRLRQHPRRQPVHGRGLHGLGRAGGRRQHRRFRAGRGRQRPQAPLGPWAIASRLGDLAEEIKITSFRVTRVGELIGREVAAELGVAFGIVDLSLAPTPTVGDSVGEILKTLGIERIGAPGSTAAVAMLNDAVKKGGMFASSSVGGLSGAFIPVSEDATLADAVGRGHLVLEKLEAMTSVCSVGLDMIAIPGDTPAETIAAIIADEMAIGVINDKTTAVRLVPVPGAKAGDMVDFGGLFGSMPVMEVRNAGASAAFVRFGGRIPAPIQSLRN